MSRKRPIGLYAGIIVILCLVGYAVWCRTGRTPTAARMSLELRSVVGYGHGSGRGNIVAIQPYVTPQDYASRASFVFKTRGYLGAAKKQGWLTPKTIVVFPEYYGAWLVVAGEKRGVYTSPTADGAMKLMAASSPVSFARALSAAKGSDRLKDALFRMKANRMADIYDSTFSMLALKYHVTIVAGTIILPSPKVENGRLAIGDGPLRSVSAVYSPNGGIAGLVVKSFPTKEEQPFVAAGRVDDIPVFDTPASKLGVLVCADSWFPQAYDVLKRKKASMVVVPSYGIGDDAVLKRTWRGYSGFANPPDVSRNDPGRITEWQASMKYALAGRLPASGIANGMAVCLRGRLWDLGTHGTTAVVRKGKVEVAPFVDGAALVSLWL